MLTSITLQNFKIFKEKMTFPLSKINLLTRTNGSGKSSWQKWNPSTEYLPFKNISNHLVDNDWDSFRKEFRKNMQRLVK